MQTLLTIGFDGERDAIEAALVSEAQSFLQRGSASRAAVNVVIGPEDRDQLGSRNTEAAAGAMVKLWNPTSPDAGIKFSLPEDARLIGAYQADEIVQKSYRQTWPSGTQSPGVKLVCLVHRSPEVTHQQFLDHWRYNHGPLAVRVQPGFWNYVQNQVTQWLTEGTPSYDGLGELHFQTTNDLLTGMFADEQARRLIYEDMARFMDDKTSTVLVTKETLVM
jgi:uncharacterized protein (TIGR02118 family)